MATIAEIRRKIVNAQEKGEDTSKLEKGLKEARLAEATAKEVAELRNVTDQRNVWRKKAEKIQERARLQGEAIGRFLELRDNLAAPIKELIDMAGMAELIKAQGECYAQYNDSGQFGWAIRDIPKGYLPDDFTCPILAMNSGLVDAHDKAAEALYYLKFAYGCLAGLVKSDMGVSGQREANDLSDDGDEPY